MFKSREDSIVFLSDFAKLGTSNWAIEYNSQCLGNFSLSMIKESNAFRIKGGGLLNFLLFKNAREAKIDFQAGFNEISQLGASIITISSDGGKLTFGTTEIDPIQFIVRLASPQRTNEWKFPLPGPISLQQTSKDGFGIRYPYLSRWSRMTSSQSNMTSSILPEGDLKIITGECQPGESLPDLTIEVFKFNKKIQALYNLIPGAPNSL